MLLRLGSVELVDASMRIDSLLKQVDADYESTIKILDSANASVDRTRTFGLALVGVLVSITLTSGLLWLGVATSVSAGLVMLADGYYSWQYGVALQHARRIERIKQAEYRVDVGGSNPRADALLLLRRLRAFRPGGLTGLHRFKWKSAWYAPPAPIFRGLYPLLIVGSLAAGFYAQATHDDSATIRVDRAVRIVIPAASDTKDLSRREMSPRTTVAQTTKTSPEPSGARRP